eukprot:3420533-Rhodomonas_salina.1
MALGLIALEIRRSFSRAYGLRSCASTTAKEEGSETWAVVPDAELPAGSVDLDANLPHVLYFHLRQTRPNNKRVT